ncbi:hypothetical protein UFOVP1616_17 [uncultured Caudovirales phage]|uniref:Uncharacterized protein n=1 Tax=uncultured Caudovirales phage TaxID=2100421 RepID=A0A6J5SJS0_9CAUD|nr:hypothetical protein UFOVP1467_33 [uncultured Caudovirales phage]CAB4219636.1 hypothetical protein UFOVP1616_17 [uncultured Caudovirales phage]
MTSNKVKDYEVEYDLAQHVQAAINIAARDMTLTGFGENGTVDFVFKYAAVHQQGDNFTLDIGWDRTSGDEDVTAQDLEETVLPKFDDLEIRLNERDLDDYDYMAEQTADLVIGGIELGLEDVIQEICDFIEDTASGISISGAGDSGNTELDYEYAEVELKPDGKFYATIGFNRVEGKFISTDEVEEYVADEFRDIRIEAQASIRV